MRPLRNKRPPAGGGAAAVVLRELTKGGIVPGVALTRPPHPCGVPGYSRPKAPATGTRRPSGATQLTRREEPRFQREMEAPVIPAGVEVEAGAGEERFADSGDGEVLADVSLIAEVDRGSEGRDPLGAQAIGVREAEDGILHRAIEQPHADEQAAARRPVEERAHVDHAAPRPETGRTSPKRAGPGGRRPATGRRSRPGPTIRVRSWWGRCGSRRGRGSG